MTTPNLAKIERVDLRDAWPNEAQDFTPWLADNIEALGEALGMDLEIQQTEAPVGGYSLDVLATDLDQNRTVVIENQLEPANHNHLGKLLTYAAWHDANVIVWLAREFGDEHLQALNWLNQRTDEDTEFFGVEVELWRIGNSLPAPHFKTVGPPNELSKVPDRSKPATLGQEQNYEWRRGLIEELKQKIGFSARRTIRSDATYLAVEFPIQNARYAARWPNGNLGFELMLRKVGHEGRDWNQRVFEALKQQELIIENGIKESGDAERVVWDSTEGRQRSRITIHRDGNVFQDTESWGEYHDWLIRKFSRFQEVLTPRLQELIQEEQQTIE